MNTRPNEKRWPRAAKQSGRQGGEGGKERKTKEGKRVAEEKRHQRGRSAPSKTHIGAHRLPPGANWIYACTAPVRLARASKMVTSQPRPPCSRQVLRGHMLGGHSAFRPLALASVSGGGGRDAMERRRLARSRWRGCLGVRARGRGRAAGARACGRPRQDKPRRNARRSQRWRPERLRLRRGNERRRR